MVPPVVEKDGTKKRKPEPERTPDDDDPYQPDVGCADPTAVDGQIQTSKHQLLLVGEVHRLDRHGPDARQPVVRQPAAAHQHAADEPDGREHGAADGQAAERPAAAGGEQPPARRVEPRRHAAKPQQELTRRFARTPPESPAAARTFGASPEPLTRSLP